MRISDLNKPDDALRNFQQALEIRRKIGDQRGIAMSLGQIANVQDGMGDSKAALASYKEAIEVERKIGDKKGLMTNLMNLGSFYLDHCKYDEALRVHQRGAADCARLAG